MHILFDAVRWRRLCFPLAALALAAGALAAWTFTSNNASATATACGRIPMAKCYALLNAEPQPRSSVNSPAALVTPEAPSAPPPAYYPSPSTVACGSSFFSATTVASLQTHFGDLSCFRFSGDDTWVLIGNAMPTSGMGVTPGGQIVATDRCAATDESCLNADATHSFADFSVFYPPRPNTAPGDLETTFSGRFLYFSDAYCGVYVFDIEAGNWYDHTALSSLLAGGSDVAPATTPPSTTGSTALTVTAPSSTGDCQ